MPWSTLKIAWRNLGRNKRRSLLAIGAIAVGQFTLVFVTSFLAGSFENILNTITGPLVGHAQAHHPEWREELAMDLYVDHLSEVRAQLAGLDAVTAILPRIYAPTLSASGEETDEPAEAEPSMLIGLDIAEESKKGGLLEHTDRAVLPGPGEALLGTVLARRLGVKAGQLLAVIGQDADGFPVSELYTVVGLVSGNVDLVKTMGILIPIAEAGALLALPDQAHEIIIRGKDSREAPALAAAVGDLPLLQEAEVLYWREALPEIGRMLDMKKWIDLIFLTIVFVAAAAGIANTATMSTFERTHEFGMLLAVGTRPNRIIHMVLIESVILGLIGVAIGSLLGTGLVLYTGHTGINYAALSGSDATDIAYRGINISFIIYPIFQWFHIVAGFLAVTLTSLLASFWPAALASRLEPVEAMRS